MVQSIAKPNCAPIWEFVAIPLASSSAAPVIRPGPRLAYRFSRSPTGGGDKPALLSDISDIPEFPYKRMLNKSHPI